jgi:hypothetical protein
MQKCLQLREILPHFAVICDLAAGYPILGPRVGYSYLKAPKAIPGAGQDRSLKLVVWVTAEPCLRTRPEILQARVCSDQKLADFASAGRLCLHRHLDMIG